MRILVNASNLVVGGGVQKAVQFVAGCQAWGHDHRWHCIVSPEVLEGLGERPGAGHVFIETAGASPARPGAGRVTRKRLNEMELEFEPDVAFSVLGPAYHRFNCPHLMGFAVPWLTHPSPLAWSVLQSWQRRFAFQLRLWYYSLWVRQADAWLMETRTSARGMTQRLDAAPSQLYVVPNCCSDFYFDAATKGVGLHPGLASRPSGERRLLVFTSYKPHKNLEIIPTVAARLKHERQAADVRFVFTLPDARPWRHMLAAAKRLGVGEMMVNVGPVPAFAGPSLYAGCDALFMPTVLETFSAVYPEAMCMERPIITSDLDFARDICGDAACYYAPTDPEAAASAIASVLGDGSVAAALVAAGRERLPAFGSGEERFRSTLAAIVDVANSVRRESS